MCTLDNAVKLREAGEFDSAIDLLQNELNLFPENAEILSLLSQCYLLKHNLDDARLYLSQAMKIAPGSALVGWNSARLFLKEKKPSKALNIAREVIKRFPDDIEGMSVLGACLLANKRVTESLEVFNRVIELNPHCVEVLINRGFINLSQKKNKEAKLDLELAHKLKPHIKEIWDIVIDLKVEAKEYSAAVTLIEKIAQIESLNYKQLATLGLCYQYLENFNLAIKSYKKALTIQPNFVEVYTNLGSIFTAQGNYSAAIKAYKNAVTIKPDNAAAYYNMANTLKRQGKLEEAVHAYQAALTSKPDFPEAQNNMANILTSVVFTKLKPGLQQSITSLLTGRSLVGPKYISQSAISLLKLDPKLKRHLQSASSEAVELDPLEIIKDLSDLPLLLELMRVCPLPDLLLEKLLTRIRSCLLLSISDLSCSTKELNFLSALALQCFTNEYLYSQSKDEDLALEALESAVEASIRNGDQPSPKFILCLASYRPLLQYDWCSSLLLTDDIQEVFKRQVSEPRLEAELKSVIPVQEDITDEVSVMVREQYEKSPYPRWTNLGLPLKTISISSMVDDVKLQLYDDAIKKIETPNILIAGCGTGQHSIATAARFDGAKVHAIDLSLSSLSYAMRKTEELGINNINYMRADILELEKLGKKFDIVESIGVLHHMNDPVEGWKILTKCLQPGGIMKIGLYSKLARQYIEEIRQEIKNAAVGSDDMAIKAFRAKMISSSFTHHRSIQNVSDFYSLSELKDLLFHVQEHQFSIPQIKKCLSELGLRFCGFESKKIVSHFNLTNINLASPYDLDKWQVYEEANPTAFMGMYQFWCQKIP